MSSRRSEESVSLSVVTHKNRQKKNGVTRPLFAGGTACTARRLRFRVEVNVERIVLAAGKNKNTYASESQAAFKIRLSPIACAVFIYDFVGHNIIVITFMEDTSFYSLGKYSFVGLIRRHNS